jgi:flagellar basal body P-ring protein FlgI
MKLMKPTLAVFMLCSATLLVLVAGFAGCQDNKGAAPFTLTPASRPAAYLIQPGIAGTVSEYARLNGGDEVPLRGYGVVVGLGKNGSGEVPANLEKYLGQLMLKYQMVAPSAGTTALTPARMLRDKDTAVVIVQGTIPPGAPVGTRFDLRVEVLPGSQATSLDGGTLMSCDLQMALTTAAADLNGAKSWGIGRGELFLNPFETDKAGDDDAAKTRMGTIPGGGVVTKSRPVYLELHQPDYRISSLIAKQVNQRLSGVGESKVAVAISPSMVRIDIPKDKREDYIHFLGLIMHVNITGGDGLDERLAKQLAQAIAMPTARCDDIALTWEAMGRQILPILRPLYTSENTSVSFYSSRTGLRLQDEMAIQPMMLIAGQGNSHNQIPAIEALGYAKWTVQPASQLRGLLSDRNSLTRVAAYEALLRHGPSAAIETIKISRDFSVDIVDSQSNFTVYCTRTGKPRIVLFGRDITIARPVFYCPKDDLVTVCANANQDKVMIYRKIPQNGKMSEPMYIAPSVTELVRKLGTIPEPDENNQIPGLGMTYSQVVGVLYQLSQGKYISADFVLQRAPEIQRIYLSGSATGRPNMPEEEQ